MVPISRIGILVMPLLIVVGCGSNESAAAPQDPPAVQAAQKTEASQVWTQERQEAYRNALSRAKTGQEGGAPSTPVSGGTGGGGGAQIGMGNTSPNVSYDNPDGDPNYAPAAQGQPASVSPSGRPSGRPDDIGSTGSHPMVGK